MKGVAYLIFSALLLALAGIASSQIDIGGGGGGNPLPDLVIFGNPVSGITYNSTTGFQCQYAGFEAELQFLDQDGDGDAVYVSSAWSGSTGLTIDSTFVYLKPSDPLLPVMQLLLGFTP